MASPSQFPKMLLLPAVLLSGVAISLGCRNAAYSDLYVENMAAEIRDLEDQLYEYDNEYHVLEQQLQALKAENERLRHGSAAQGTPSRGNNTPPRNNSQPQREELRGLEFTPREETVAPSSKPAPTVEPPTNSILEPPGAKRDPAGQQLLEDTLPALPPRQSTEELNPSLLDIPTIEPGTPMPPPLPVSRDFTNSSDRSQSHDMELNLSRIDVPAQLASNLGPAQLKLGAEKPTDMKVVEIAFHPSLTRAANFDDEPDDDGLYLVLQPKNAAGQMVPTPAALDIAVLDPSREGDAARIGRWTYSAVEVKAKLQPIGSNQGIHLSLPWNGPDPAADRVIVFIRYTFPDGRQVVNDKHIFVSGKGSMKTVWVPRSTDESPVTAASFERSTSPVPNVIRPPGNSALGGPEAAPLPRGY